MMINCKKQKKSPINKNISKKGKKIENFLLN